MSLNEDSKDLQTTPRGAKPRGEPVQELGPAVTRPWNMSQGFKAQKCDGGPLLRHTSTARAQRHFALIRFLQIDEKLSALVERSRQLLECT